MTDLDIQTNRLGHDIMVGREKLTNHEDVASTKDDVLLIITPTYPNLDDSYFGGSFVKNQVAEIKKYYKKVIVISPVFNSLGYRSNDRLCKDYQ